MTKEYQMSVLRRMREELKLGQHPVLKVEPLSLRLKSCPHCGHIVTTPKGENK